MVTARGWSYCWVRRHRLVGEVESVSLFPLAVAGHACCVNPHAAVPVILHHAGHIVSGWVRGRRTRRCCQRGGAITFLTHIRVFCAPPRGRAWSLGILRFFAFDAFRRRSLIAAMRRNIRSRRALRLLENLSDCVRPIIFWGSEYSACSRQQPP